MNSNYNKGMSRLVIALCTVGMSLASCSSDDALSNNEETKAVKVAISTRSGESGTEDYQWLANDVITLQAYASGAATQTATYTYKDETSQWSTETGLYWDSYQTKLDFLGYYPSTATADGLKFTLPTDQSDATKLHAADYMTTDRIVGVSNINDGTEVAFAFNHRLVKITMNVTWGEEYADTKPTLSLERILSQGSEVTVTANTDNSTKSTVAATGTTALVQPLIGTSTDGNPCYKALVTPGTLTSGSTVLMTLSVNSEMRQATYNGSLTALESGNAYSFNVKVGRDKVEITSATVNGLTGWGDAENETDL